VGSCGTLTKQKTSQIVKLYKGKVTELGICNNDSWVGDTAASVDAVNGFIEVYNDFHWVISSFWNR